MSTHIYICVYKHASAAHMLALVFLCTLTRSRHLMMQVSVAMMLDTVARVNQKNM